MQKLLCGHVHTYIYTKCADHPSLLGAKAISFTLYQHVHHIIAPVCLFRHQGCLLATVPVF